MSTRTFQFLALLLLLSFSASAAERVTLMRTPNGGIQPQGQMDSAGTLHLIYYKGDAGGGDVFYVKQTAGETNFTAPIQVNSKGSTAIAAGTIRGPQMTLGRNGRVHVAWNGIAPNKGDYMLAPMLYTRLNDAKTAFEPERDVITAARGLDGGGSVAADNKGNVYVMWHAPKPGNTNGEAGRALFVAKSGNDGKTFAPEKAAIDKETGACGCCGMKAFADAQGNLFALYRAAGEKVNRDEIMVISRNQGVDFQIALQHPWKIGGCPMSSASITETPTEILTAWETKDRIYFSRINSKALSVGAPLSAPEGVRGKHPVVVGNAKGEMLLAWTEGTGWAKGGSLAWQLYDANGKASGAIGRADGVPVWGLVSAFVKPDGSFELVY